MRRHFLRKVLVVILLVVPVITFSILYSYGIVLQFSGLRLKRSTEFKPADVRLIYTGTKSHTPFQRITFDGCEFSNCIAKGLEARTFYTDADLVIFEYAFLFSSPTISFPQRSNQIWVFLTSENPALVPLRASLVDGYFNATMNYRFDSDIPFPYGAMTPRTPSAAQSDTAYITEKTRGAFAYVSNCHANYNRLKVMETLGEYLDVDIFGGCTGKRPCSQVATEFDNNCESKLHGSYRFYLSFENSRCKDYITEKFWHRLGSDSLFVPVAVGGWSMNDYTKQAPPNSFIHIDNFTSVHELGKYLKHLLTDDQAYSRYHEWRKDYEIIWSSPACRLCELANKKSRMPVIQNLSKWFNSDTNCRSKNYV